MLRQNVCSWELFQGFVEGFIHNLNLKLCAEISGTIEREKSPTVFSTQSLGSCKCCHMESVPLGGSVASSKKLKPHLEILNYNASLVWQTINTLRFIWSECVFCFLSPVRLTVISVIYNTSQHNLRFIPSDSEYFSKQWIRYFGWCYLYGDEFKSMVR